MNKLKLAILAVTPLLALAGCGGNQEDPDAKTTTIINIENFGGGVGSEWLEDAIARFRDIHKEESYEEGKTGVKIKFSNNKSIDTSSMKGSGKHIYFTETNGFPHDLAANGNLLDIDDIVRGKAYGDEVTIESKIDENYRQMLQYNGKYVALPHYEWYPGLTYDVDLFETKKLYLAAPGETRSVPFVSFGETYNFVGNSSAKKSCGNDGIYGTDDDGLPSSLKEFIALCKYMKHNSISPIVFPGNHQDYSDYLLEGLLASLSGKEGIRSYYEFSGKAKVVTGYLPDDGNFIVQGSGIRTPIVEEVDLSEKEGYKTRMTYERYAAISLLSILDDKENACLDLDITTSSYTNENVQTLFLNGARSGGSTKDYGMMCEGNYWVNEASGRIADFYRQHPEVTERRFAWMSLPVNVSESVTEGNGKTQALMDTGNSFCLVNKTVENNPGVKKAVLDFIKFIYSDNELSAFTKKTGVCKAGMAYDYSSEAVVGDLNAYQKTVLNLKKTCGVTYTGATNETFLAKRDDFIFSISSPIWQPGTYKSVIEALRSKRYDAEQCFESTQISKDDWDSKYYKGA